MATPFRLAYNSGYDYVDLLPYTKLEAIQGIGNIIKYTTVDVEIPAFEGLKQDIKLTLTEKQKIAPFTVEPLDNSVSAKRDYASIDGIEVTADGISILRLSRGSKAPIKARLRFVEGGL